MILWQYTKYSMRLNLKERNTKVNKCNTHSLESLSFEKKAKASPSWACWHISSSTIYIKSVQTLASQQAHPDEDPWMVTRWDFGLIGLRCPSNIFVEISSLSSQCTIIGSEFSWLSGQNAACPQEAETLSHCSPPDGSAPLQMPSCGPK